MKAVSVTALFSARGPRLSTLRILKDLGKRRVRSQLRVHKGHPFGDGNCAEATDAEEFRGGVMCRVVSSSGRQRK